jgi:DNA repair exonuclease SbcCD ATPase subunit
MLISLHMKNWRKHVDRTIVFSNGLNAVRGPNEGGKTSLLLAIAYALWGIKAMPLPLAEMVTYGLAEKEAKVTLVMKKGDSMYSFTRHKNGAECLHDGGTVTGQDEVSKFASALLGADAQTAMKLMFAPQGELRGALQAGPTAISQYIEDMSGMDLFDRLMDAFNERLTTGPTTKLDNEVSDLEAKLEAGGPTPPDTTEVDAKISALSHADQGLQRTLTMAEEVAKKANDDYTEQKAAADVRTRALASLEAAQGALERKKYARDQDAVTAAVEVDERRIPLLEEGIRDEQAQEARRSAHTAFSKLPTVEVEWDEGKPSLEAAIASSRAKVQELREKVSDLNTKIKVAESQKTTSSICGFCQQDLSQFPDVAKKNAELDASIATMTAERATLVAQGTEAAEELKDLEAVLASAAPFNAFLQRHAQYVEVDEQYVPPRITWKGAAPSAPAPTTEMARQLAELKAALVKKQAAVARLAVADEAIASDELLVSQLKAAVPVPVDLAELQHAKAMADTKVVELRTALREGREELQALETVKARGLAEFRIAERQFAQVKVDLEERREERRELEFNNTLVKKVKAARPVVAAELWAVVLTSVSVMFSQMRGEQSVVTKGTKGFLVNGRPAEGLSGSALDLLGFSIRVAMLKTFIPDCSFLVLDEATSACDDDRTASLMGFIASAGFPQTLLVTHEAAAEAVADNVIMV